MTSKSCDLRWGDPKPEATGTPSTTINETVIKLQFSPKFGDPGCLRCFFVDVVVYFEANHPVFLDAFTPYQARFHRVFVPRDSDLEAQWLGVLLRKLNVTALFLNTTKPYKTQICTSMFKYSNCF